MKKLIYLLSISSVMMLFTSCFEELDNWYTNTASYDGRFVVAKTCAEFDDYNTPIDKAGEEVMIYNSAANVENEIIIDTHINGGNLDGDFVFPIKSKFQVKGNSSSFSAEQSSENISRTELSDDDFVVIYENDYYFVSDLGSPEGLGEEYDAVQLYSRVALNEGKITPQGAKTIGGNTSDAVSLKITLYSEYLIIESYELPKDKWVDPTVPEYDWRIKEGSRHNADGWEEHWTLDGYRYTGYPEDDPTRKPPIIVK